MKIQFALWMTLLVLLFSCKKDKNNQKPADTNDPFTQKGTLTAKLPMDTAFHSFGLIQAIHSGGSFDIKARSSKAQVVDTTQLEIVFPDTLTLNSPFRDTTGTRFFITWQDPLTGTFFRSAFSQSTGAITITSFDPTAHTITGTFSGNIVPSGISGPGTQLSNGTFNTTYTSYPQ